MKPRLRRILHRLFITLAALATLIVLFYTEEDWRGARSWATTRHGLQAQGESLDLRVLIPPPVPDDQNVALAPLFRRAFAYWVDPRYGQLAFDLRADWMKNDTDKAFREMPWGEQRQELPRPSFPNWTSGHAMDLGVLQSYYRLRPDFPKSAQPRTPADDVLLALTRYEPLLDQYAQTTAERPQTRFPVLWTKRPSWSIALPHYSRLQSLASTLRLRAVAELAASQTPAARRDIALGFRLRQGVKDDPVLIAGLVDNTMIGLLIQPIWEGLAARQWSATDLDALRDELQDINALWEYQQEVRGELVVSTACWADDMQDRDQAREFARMLPDMTNMTIGEEEGASWFTPKRWLWQLLPYWPRGWYEQNAAVASGYLKEDGIDLVDPVNRRVLLAKTKEADQVLKNIPMTPYTAVARVFMSVYPSVSKKFAQTQTTVDEAITACTLEKYYLDHHTYPAALAMLVPQYLDRVPNDVIDGAPLRYRLTVDGRYQLYSIGWNGKDDGGPIDWPPDRKWRRAASGSPAGQEQPFPSPSRDQSDWVWQYAPAEPPEPPGNQSRLESLR